VRVIGKFDFGVYSIPWILFRQIVKSISNGEIHVRIGEVELPTTDIPVPEHLLKACKDGVAISICVQCDKNRVFVFDILDAQEETSKDFKPQKFTVVQFRYTVKEIEE